MLLSKGAMEDSCPPTKTRMLLSEGAMGDVPSPTHKKYISKDNILIKHIK